jgi:hypothetical protein
MVTLVWHQTVPILVTFVSRLVTLSGEAICVRNRELSKSDPVRTLTSDLAIRPHGEVLANHLYVAAGKPAWVRPIFKEFTEPNSPRPIHQHSQ